SGQPLCDQRSGGCDRGQKGGGHGAGSGTRTLRSPLDPGVLPRPPGPRRGRRAGTGRAGSRDGGKQGLMERNANYALVGLASAILTVGLVVFLVLLAGRKFSHDFDTY